MRVGHLIEYQQRAASGILGQCGELRLGQLFGLEHRALMHGISAQDAVEIARRRLFNFVGDRTQRLDKAAFGILGQYEAIDLAGRVAQRRFDGV